MLFSGGTEVCVADAKIIEDPFANHAASAH
jgi:hypothetical protein